MNRRRTLLIIVCIVSISLPATIRAVDIVFDPTNFGVNVEQVLHHVEVLARLAEQIRNQLRMLKNWQFTRLDELLASMGAVRGAIDEAGVLDLGDRYSIWPDSYSKLDAHQVEELRRQWLESQRTALIHAQTLQNRAASEMPVTQDRVSAYAERANNAPGQTAVLQATNETLATFAGQLQTLQALDISQSRIELEEEAHRQAQAAFWRQRREALMQDWPTQVNQPSETQAVTRSLFSANQTK